MSEYIVSARKYRPQTFDTVVGQKALTTTLKNAIQSKHLAHAYLFCGPRGVGKTTCARIFAKTINCFNPTENGEACNECESCKAFNEGASFNIHELDAASNNSVDDIRALVDKVRIPPAVGKYSVYIIDEVHMLSTAAFNAFLKTLEEPPSYAIFILATTEKHKIIPTILSRCQIYDFNRIKIDDTIDYLEHVAQNEGIEAEREALNVIAQKADGAMRDALSIFDQVTSFCGNRITYQDAIKNLNVLDYEYYFKMVDALRTGNVSTAFMMFDEILNKGFDGQHFVTGLASHFRDVLVSKDAVTLQLLDVSQSVVQKYQEQANNCDVHWLYKAIELATDCDINYKNSKNKRLHVEAALIRLATIGVETESKKDESELPIITKSAVASTPTANIQPIAATAVVSEQPRRSVTIPGMFNMRYGSQHTETRDKVEKNEIQGQSKQQPVTQHVLNDGEIWQMWRDYAQKLETDDYVQSIMLNSKLHLAGNEGNIIVDVASETQRAALEKYKEDILIKLREYFGNGKIVMTYEVMAPLQKGSTILMSDSEKLLRIEAKSKSFKELSIVMQLEPI